MPVVLTFSLLLPLFSIDIEDSISQEDAHGVAEPRPLLVLPERGLEDVLDQRGVGADVDEGRRAQHARRPGHPVAQLVRNVHLSGEAAATGSRHAAAMSAHPSAAAPLIYVDCVLRCLCESLTIMSWYRSKCLVT